MFRHGNARHAVLLLMVLAVAFLWTADQGIRAAAQDRADTSATLASASEHEKRVCAVLQQVWFAALIGWMSGLNKQSEVVAQVRSAAELLLR